MVPLHEHPRRTGSPRYRTSATLATTLLTLAVAPASRAQTVPPKPNGRIEEVVVTAQKRKSTALKTPVSMEVLSGATIAQKGITDIQSLATMNSSVNFATGGGEGYVTIRGVSSQNTTEIGDPSVPISTDGFFLNRPYTFNESLYDVARIEVLRGPEGTLYGRNATGGVINVVDNQPGRTLTGYEQVEVGNYGELDSTGAINVPLSDTFQIRTSYETISHEGYRNNAPAGNGDSEYSQSGRIALSWQPTPDLSGTVVLQYTHVGGTGPTDEVLNLQYLPNNTDIVHNLHYTGNGSAFPLVFLPQVDTVEKALRWNFVYDALPGGIKLTYLGGFDVIDWHHLAPNSATNANGYNQHEQPQTQNHEVRLTSPSGDRLSWQTGVFYFREDSHLNSIFESNANTLNPGLLYQFNYGITTISYAAYGQANYKITPTLTLSAGLRYTYDQKQRNGYFNLAEYGLFFPDPGETGHWARPTFHVGLDWTPDPNTLVYAKVDSGYKSGGFNGYLKPEYQPETLLAYEVGVKALLFDRRLSLSTDAFYEDYTNQQVSELGPIGNGGTGVIIQNAGASKIYGIDVGAVADLDPVGRLDLNVTAMNAQISSFLASNALGTQNFQLAGNQLPQAPNVSLTTGFEHSWLAKGGTITARIETKFQSSQYFSFFNYPDSRVAPYTMSNAYLRFNTGDGHWTGEFFIRNLENATVLADYAENVAGGFYNFGFAPPRTYGFRLRYGF